MLKRFIAISMVIHVIVLLVLIYVVKDKEKKKDFMNEEPLVAKIITPEKEKPGANATEPKEGGKTRQESIPSVTVPPSSPVPPRAPTPPMAPKTSKSLPPVAKNEESPAFRPKVYKDRTAPPKGKGIENEARTGPPATESPRETAPPVASGQKKAEMGQKQRSSQVPSRGSLFDSEIIARHAAEEPVKEHSHMATAQKKGNALEFDVDDMQYGNYMKRVKASVESAWIYPQSEARKGVYGDLYIEFTIKKNGVLGDVRIIRTSGNSNLDEAALQSIKDAAPFWPLPNDWGKDSFTIKGHFVYSLFDQNIR
ncbi:MAG: energy transducer TonB [Nitrospirae bacterium]|nr:energy transducer TonB [Nitrospirota bacterium]